MKKFIIAFLFFYLLLNNNIVFCSTSSKYIAEGIYTLNDLTLSPDSKYTVKNDSFNERVYIIIFDSKPNLIQSVRLIPQSKKYNLKPLEADYKIVILGHGTVTISPRP